MRRDRRFLNLLATLSVAQATAFVALLGIAMPVKYFAGYGAGVTVIGALHGVAWLLYMWLVLAMVTLGMWNRGQVLRLVLSALLPFGGFVTAVWIHKNAYFNTRCASISSAPSMPTATRKAK